jgi:ubiquinone/menaquinone biosynthesis C-methylase UbiE
MNDHTSLGWGIVDAQGAEIWDAHPVFHADHVTWKDKLRLLFYPKRFVLYRHIARVVRSKKRRSGEKFRILDVGCGTGATLVDLKKMFGKDVEVVGIDVVKIQVQLAKQKIKKHGVWASVHWFDGLHMAFEDASFDAVYTSDVLGHVSDVEAWLAEIHRILAPDGLLAMFAESKLGKHAYIRNYFLRRGCNTDPHAQFHISLYAKQELLNVIESTGFHVVRMMSTVWAKFFVHPDEMYEPLKQSGRFPVLHRINAALCWIKKKTHPYSSAICELYSLGEMFMIGRWIESQGYVIVAKKRR